MIGALVGDIYLTLLRTTPRQTRGRPPLRRGERASPMIHSSPSPWRRRFSPGGTRKERYAAFFREYGSRYPECGFGRSFRAWLRGEGILESSFGNGSAMRVSPVGYAFETLEQVLDGARRSAAPSHGHPEGIKGAQAVAAAVFLARKSVSRDEIASFLRERFGYDFSARSPWSAGAMSF